MAEQYVKRSGISCNSISYIYGTNSAKGHQDWQELQHHRDGEDTVRLEGRHNTENCRTLVHSFAHAMA